MIMELKSTRKNSPMWADCKGNINKSSTQTPVTRSMLDKERGGTPEKPQNTKHTKNLKLGSTETRVG